MWNAEFNSLECGGKRALVLLPDPIWSATLLWIEFVVWTALMEISDLKRAQSGRRASGIQSKSLAFNLIPRRPRFKLCKDQCSRK
jgi:hypothetical protein